MKWFDKWFQRQAKKAWDNYDDNPRLIKTVAGSAAGNGHELSSQGAATLRIHAAHGGKVIEISNWDERKGEHDRDLYIVRDEDELGPELTSIIMQHSLRY